MSIRTTRGNVKKQLEAKKNEEKMDAETVAKVIALQEDIADLKGDLTNYIEKQLD